MTADNSFFDVAATYGITLADLFKANPQVNPSLPLAAYNNTILTIPQLCGGVSMEPPTTTVAANCPLYWPLCNMTRTGTETCGTIAKQYCQGDIKYLNEMNGGICPSANVAIPGNTRWLCIAPKETLVSQKEQQKGRRLAARLPSSSMPCTLKAYVGLGASCSDIMSTYGISQGELQGFNPGLNCSTLTVGREVCVERREGGSEYIIPQVLVSNGGSGGAAAGSPSNQRPSSTSPKPSPPSRSPKKGGNLG
ncbi:hypothetical protein HYH02_014335 [Chlamydomonas schloesseri]|uniref:LysM domain-containing protein n=1 Tax=Chlamydomonas schloesseri TaxID=2026947 RepID=A0A835VXB8_9CHLO|nr:hypothetical protein HYH02_014335 [Chlamydomonas schloesseri]|eukprot:KAG2428531.1 hypothetical protein HYH02_014335 [Chlamydomonas schloesseri]